MATIALRLTSGRCVAFEVDTAATGPACFVLSLARSGSTLLNDIVLALARANGYPSVDVGSVFFDANVRAPEYSTDPALSDLIHPGNVYAAFRIFPTVLAWNPLFEAGPKILMVRDPRDALVSMYFSEGWSHRLPEDATESEGELQFMEQQRLQVRSLSIDDYVLLRARLVTLGLLAYVPLINDPTVCLLRYEDVVFDKSLLITTVARHFGWEVDAGMTASILSAVDVARSQDEPMEHIRHVTPGDHRDKLLAETTAVLDRVLEDVMVPFGYHP